LIIYSSNKRRVQVGIKSIQLSANRVWCIQTERQFLASLADNFGLKEFSGKLSEYSKAAHAVQKINNIVGSECRVRKHQPHPHYNFIVGAKVAS